MAGKHTQNVTKFTANDLDVYFSPEVRERLNDLGEALVNSQHFSFETLKNLNEIVEGEPTTVRGAVMVIADVVRSAGNHVRATSDKKVDDLLRSLTESLIPDPDRVDPVSVIKAPVKRQGGEG